MCLQTSLSLRVQVDVRDPRFQAMFTSHLFNLDPSDPAYRSTRATQGILDEKQRRREGRGQREATPPTDPGTRLDPGLSLLVKSIKKKTSEFQRRKKPRLSQM